MQYRLSTHDVLLNTDSLIDGGANSGLSGSDVTNCFWDWRFGTDQPPFVNGGRTHPHNGRSHFWSVLSVHSPWYWKYHSFV
jgi:hypothetical protein